MGLLFFKVVTSNIEVNGIEVCGPVEQEWKSLLALICMILVAITLV